MYISVKSLYLGGHICGNFIVTFVTPGDTAGINGIGKHGNKAKHQQKWCSSSQ